MECFKNRSNEIRTNEIRTNEIRIRREPPVSRSCCLSAIMVLSYYFMLNSINIPLCYVPPSSGELWRFYLTPSLCSHEQAWTFYWPPTPLFLSTQLLNALRSHLIHFRKVPANMQQLHTVVVKISSLECPSVCLSSYLETNTTEPSKIEPEILCKV